MTAPEKIYIAGHKGMVGSALERALKTKSNIEILTATRQELDLLDQREVDEFLKSKKPDQIYMAAARVGGIHANKTYPANFIYENLVLQCNIINSAFEAGIKRILFLGSSCIYPKNAKQPMSEGALLESKLEPTNEPYAVAKIAGIKLCESYNRQYGKSHQIDYRSAMPTNLYGPGDSYHSENSHVIPALIKRFHEAKTSNSGTVTIWGSGKPYREFLFVDDLADACIEIMSLDKANFEKFTNSLNSHINIGYGQDITIANLAVMISGIVGFKGKIKFDESKPDGTPKKLLNSGMINKLGWKPKVSLHEGLEKTYLDFLENQ